MADASLGLWTVPLAVFGGAIRVSTPFLFVSLGECITERSGRINLGLEGTLVMGALFVLVVLFLPKGLAGLAQVILRWIVQRRQAASGRVAQGVGQTEGST